MANRMIGGRQFRRLAEPTLSNSELIRSGGNVADIQRTATPSNPVVPVPTEPDVTTNRLNFGTDATIPRAPGAFDLGAGTDTTYGVGESVTPFDRGDEVIFQQGLSSWLQSQGTGYYAGAEQDYENVLSGGGYGTGATTLDEFGSPTLDLAREQEARAQRELGGAERTAEEELAAAFSKIDEEQRAIYAPRYAQLEREGARAQETQRRGFSFRGFGKSSRAIEEEERLNEQVRAESAALSAEESAAIRLQRAAARGASEEELAGLRNSLNTASLRVSEMEEARAKEEEGLTAASIAAGQKAESDRLKARAEALEAAGLVEDPDTGERVATLKARAQALDETVGLGGLGIKQGEFAMKQARFPLEYAKLEADLAKLNKSLRGGTGGKGGGINFGVDDNGNITGLDPLMLSSADGYYRNADGDIAMALDDIDNSAFSSKQKDILAKTVQTLDLASITATETGQQAIPNFQNGSIDFITPEQAESGALFGSFEKAKGKGKIRNLLGAEPVDRQASVDEFISGFDMTNPSGK